jgi:hypothetical protein
MAETGFVGILTEEVTSRTQPGTETLVNRAVDNGYRVLKTRHTSRTNPANVNDADICRHF